MRVSVLGPLVVDTADGTLGPRDRVVLSALALRGDGPVSIERLADALWRDDVPQSWNKVVQGCVVRLRKVLGPGAIETQGSGYRLAVPADEIDARRFEWVLVRARELLALGEPDRAMYAADEALALWRGQPFAEIEDWEPAQIEARRLLELRMEAEELRLDAALRSGRHREVLASARAAVDAAATRERRWELLAVAQYRSGRQGDALRTLREARVVLSRELGLDPGPDLVALEQAILKQDPGLAGPQPPPEPTGVSPWPGLLSYGVGDADEFFGRHVEVSACLHRLAADGVVVVVGPSGSGKSSLARAGIAAALQRSGRRVELVTPGGGRPLDALSGLRAGGPPPVLVVDQCEEAVASTDPDERDAFFDALVAHAARAPLVVTLRADRVADISAHADFARLVERGLFLLGPMSEPNLRSAIEEPARRAALLLEPGLVDLIVRDVLDEPGALPLMSHALRQTWVRRQGRTLTVAAYRETGGIRGAVAQTAESVYARADDDERRKLRDLLLRLVFPGDNGEPGRARVPRQVLSDDPVYARLIERLVAARLLTSDEEVVELAHDALARAWPRLQDWLDEDVEGVRVLRHLSTAAAGWDALGRPASELYRGVRLAQAVEWRERVQPDLTAVERAFLDASVDVETADLRTAQAQVERERRTVRRLRRLAGAVTALVLATGAVSLIAVDQRRQADEEATVADARRIAAEALVEEPYDRALLLAVEAVRRWESPETRGNLLTTIERRPQVASVLRGAARLLDLALSADGRRAVVVDGNGTVTLYDLATRRPLATRTEPGVSFRAPTLSPDGLRLAVSRIPNSCFYQQRCSESSIDILDPRTLEPVGTTYQRPGGPAVSIAFSPRGDLLAAVPPHGFTDPVQKVAVWRVGEPGGPAWRLTVPEPGRDFLPTPDHLPWAWLAFSPDGSRLYASGAGPTFIFDVDGRRRLGSVPSRGGVALSPDGTTLAAFSGETTIGLFDTATGDMRTELSGHAATVVDAAFGADGKSVATASNDETVAVWDTATGARRHVLQGHDGSVTAVAFGPDQSSLYSSAADQALISWDLERRAGLARNQLAASGSVPADFAVLLSPSADTFVVLGVDARLVDMATGRAITLERPGFTWASFSPDGRRLVTVGYDGSTRLWDVGTLRPVLSRAGRGQPNNGAVAFSHDGASVVVADADGRVTELDARSLEPTGRHVDIGLVPAGVTTAPGGAVAVTEATDDPSDGTAVAFADLDGGAVRRVETPSPQPRASFSDDGSRYALGGSDGRLRVVDVASGRVSGPRDPVHAGPVTSVVFSPDGSTLVSVGFDGQVILSDPATGVTRARLRLGPRNINGTAGYRADGHTLVLAYKDGSAITYETDSDAWIEHACRVAGRNLTVDEWHDTFGDESRRDTCPTHS